MSSFSTLLMPSASHWRKPAGPVRFGPMRLWIRPATRRSTHVVTPAIGRMKTNATMPPKTSIAPSQALAEDLAALLHLAHADHVAVEAVAERAELAAPDRHVEVELGIDGVRQVAPDVVADAGTAQVRADEVVVDRLLRADGGHVSQPLRVDLVVGDERVVLVDQRLETDRKSTRLNS